MLDILMITHNRLEYLMKALPAVLAQDYKEWRLKIWDNGSDQKTVDWLKSLRSNKITIYFNKTNDSLASVTSRIFLNSDAEFVGKVDSDTIVPPNWAHRLIVAHERYHFGFIGGFHFRPDDLVGRNPNIEALGGSYIWRKSHIGGCSFIIRRADFKGYTGEGVMGLTEYQIEMGLPNGYLWEPVLWVDHMEDPRSPHYIATEEYNQYKIKTRGVTLAQYAGSISHQGYLNENTK